MNFCRIATIMNLQLFNLIFQHFVMKLLVNIKTYLKILLQSKFIDNFPAALNIRLLLRFYFQPSREGLDLWSKRRWTKTWRRTLKEPADWSPSCLRAALEFRNNDGVFRTLKGREKRQGGCFTCDGGLLAPTPLHSARPRPSVPRVSRHKPPCFRTLDAASCSGTLKEPKRSQGKVLLPRRRADGWSWWRSNWIWQHMFSYMITVSHSHSRADFRKSSWIPEGKWCTAAEARTTAETPIQPS